MNNRPLLQTKFYIPPSRANGIPRARLTQQLDHALEHSQQLIVIAAPAGFGKTTVVSEWLVNCGKRSEERRATDSSTVHALLFTWLSLDDTDNDPARFWTYFIAALQTSTPQVGETAQALLQGDSALDYETLVTLLLNDLADETQTHVLVLDDYHVITNDAIHNALAFLLDHLPQKFFLVLTTRFDPPFPLSRLRARGKLLELRADELRFTADEAAKFLQRALGVTLTAAQIAALEERTEGWIAGLQLAALAMSSNRTRHEQSDVEKFITAFTGSHRYVMDYLVDEVLARQDDATQNFLLQTSILERFNAELCDAIIERDTNFILHPSAFILQDLARANLFLVALDDAREWQRYHHLFAELLRHRLQKTRAALVPVLHRRASDWFEQNDFGAEAIEHAFAANDSARAVELLNTHIAAFTARGERTTIQQWLARLPSDAVAHNPPLALAQAHAFIMEHALERAEACVQQAEQAIGLYPHARWRERALGEIARSRVYLAYFCLEYAQAEDIAKRALQELNLSVDVRAEILQGLGLVYNARRQNADAARVFAQAIDACFAGGEVYQPIMISGNLAEVYILTGELGRAQAVLEKILAHAAAHHLAESPLTAIIHETLAEIFYKRGELAVAEFHVAHALEKCEQGKQTRILFFTVTLAARLAHARGDFARAQNELDKAKRLADQVGLIPRTRMFAHYTQVGLWLDQGNLDAANEWATHAALATDRALTLQDVLAYRAFTRILLARGDTDVALAVLARLQAIGQPELSVESAINIQTLYAVAHAAHRDSRAAMAALHKAFALAEPERFVLIFFQTGATLYPLLQEFRALMEKRERAGTPDAARFIVHCDRVLESFAPLVANMQTPPASTPPVEMLTPRESQVLNLIAQGKSNQEIADELFLSLSAIKKYTGVLFEKLDVHNRTEAVAKARELGLL